MLAGFLAERMVALGRPFADWEADVAAGFREVAGRDLRTWPVVAHALWNWALPQFRVNHLVRRYHTRLTKLRLKDLPARPEFFFCATDLLFGVNWKFHREESGDWAAGYSDLFGEWPLSRAIAASACFPPIFGPMPLNLKPGQLKRGRYSNSALIPFLSLSDGGVYDNIGLEPVWKDHSYVFVSDCGAPFEFQFAKTPIRRIRTDLDAFTPAEMCVLENHGYLLAEASLRRRVPELIPAGAWVAAVPHPDCMEEDKVRRVLSHSHKRVSLRRMLGLSSGPIGRRT
jgi:predicted acylesterase/phospholipase RssA